MEEVPLRPPGVYPRKIKRPGPPPTGGTPAYPQPGRCINCGTKLTIDRPLPGEPIVSPTLCEACSRITLEAKTISHEAAMPILLAPHKEGVAFAPAKPSSEKPSHWGYVGIATVAFFAGMFALSLFRTAPTPQPPAAAPTVQQPDRAEVQPAKDWHTPDPNRDKAVNEYWDKRRQRGRAGDR
ncbi:MAG: hypothetical protein K8T91_08515 [Planctomycetes bacterium]|nr:hypothetical protein [Planctomycetota bacterium]